MGEFNSDDHYIYYCRQEALRRNGVAIMVTKRVQNAVLGCNLKNDRMISVRLQGKPFNITVIQVYMPTSNAEETEVERFYEDLPDLLELTPKKDVLFLIGDWNAKVGSQQIYDHQKVNIKIRLTIFFAAEDGEALYRQQKKRPGANVAQTMNFLLQNSDLN